MVELVAHAAKSHEFHPNSLRVSLAEIAKRSCGDASTVARALEEGWEKGAQTRRSGREQSLTKRNSDFGGSGTGWD